MRAAEWLGGFQDAVEGPLPDGKGRRRAGQDQFRRAQQLRLFTNLQYDVGQARRGWLEKDDGSTPARSQRCGASTQAHHVKAPPDQQHFRRLHSQARGQEDP